MSGPNVCNASLYSSIAPPLAPAKGKTESEAMMFSKPRWASAYDNQAEASEVVMLADLLMRRARAGMTDSSRLAATA